MINPKAEVIGHIPPRPRIQIGPPDKKPASPYCDPVDALKELDRIAEARRIWELIEQSCNGHGAAQ